MLTCNACMRQCLQTIIGESVFISSRPAVSSLPRQSFRNNYSTSSFTAASPDSKPQDKNGNRGNLSRQEERQQWLQSRGATPDHKRQLPVDDFVVRKHLAYLKDPLKLADFVRSTLRSNDFDTALEVVRAASKKMLCTVSWNHLVDYQMQQKKMNAAIKTYNEMKKRAQHPDAHTYTLLFRGCAAHPDSEHALEKCMAIYHTMLSEKSAIKPNVIHMNAVLKMCARANNVEAMFAIAGSLGRKGIAAPNNLSFTTILNGLRMSVYSDNRLDLTPMQRRENNRNAIFEARKTWARLVALWRQGEVWIDEELVSSMGRMLLVGEQRDIDDILSLVEQAMGIPRQAPPSAKTPGNKEDPTMQVQGLLPAELNAGALPSEPRVPDPVEAAHKAHDDSSSLQEVIPTLFTAATSAGSLSSGAKGFAKPGNNSLSLLLAACLKLKLKDAATNYWKIFMDLGVDPDVENFHAYLRILRISRSSSETVQVLLSMKQQDLQHKTFRIAMSTCERDKLNRNAFANAGKILDLMQMTGKEESISVLSSYLQVAISSPAQSLAVIQGSDSSKLQQGRVILRALDRLNPSVLKIKARLFFAEPGLPGKTSKERQEANEDATLLFRNMISAYDRLLRHGMVVKDQVKDIKKKQQSMAALLNRAYFSRQSQGKPATLIPNGWTSKDEEIEDSEDEPPKQHTVNEPLSRDPRAREAPTWGSKFSSSSRSANRMPH